MSLKKNLSVVLFILIMLFGSLSTVMAEETVKEIKLRNELYNCYRAMFLKNKRPLCEINYMSDLVYFDAVKEQFLSGKINLSGSWENKITIYEDVVNKRGLSVADKERLKNQKIEELKKNGQIPCYENSFFDIEVKKNPARVLIKKVSKDVENAYIGTVYSTDYDYPIRKWGEWNPPFKGDGGGPDVYYLDPTFELGSDNGVEGGLCSYKIPETESIQTRVPCSVVVGFIIQAGNTMYENNPYKDTYIQSAIYTYLRDYAKCGKYFGGEGKVVDDLGSLGECQMFLNQPKEFDSKGNIKPTGSNDFMKNAFTLYFGSPVYHFRNRQWNGNLYNYYKDIDNYGPSNPKYEVDLIFLEAFKNYHEYREAQKEINKLNKEYIEVLIGGASATNAKLYYNPQSGKYVSKKIIVKSKVPDKVLKIFFDSNNNTSVNIKFVGEEGSKKISDAAKELYKGQLEFYLESSNESNVDLTIKASFSAPEFHKYDTYRWHAGNASGIVGFKTSTGYIEISQEVKMSFNPFIIEKKHCPNELKIGDRKLDSSPKTIQCENNSGSLEYSHIAEYGKCVEKSVDLGDGKQVAVLLYEHAKFRFGPVLGDIGDKGIEVNNGRGFELQRRNFTPSSDSSDTNYSNTISWEYANFDANGVRYYYNKDNEEYNQIEITDKDFAKNVNNYILDKVIGDEPKLNLNFSTYDSNEVNKEGNGKDYEYKLNSALFCKPNDDNINWIDCSFANEDFAQNGLKLREALIKIDDSGTVEYISDEEYDQNKYKSGGNKYYVPNNFNSGVDNKNFKFDINKNDISLIGNEFDLTGYCSPIVLGGGSLYDLVRYRSIDLNNPFPSATNDNNSELVPINWREWYWENDSNKYRLRSSYDRGTIYVANINAENYSKIKDGGIGYMSWTNIAKSGYSKFIDNSNLFSKVAGSDSYCALGEMDSDKCDAH